MSLAAALPPLPAASVLSLLGVGALVCVGGFLIALPFLRGESVEEVFLVHDSGLLLVHFSRVVRQGQDRDIVVGMLTAIQDFIRDAFTKGTTKELRQVDFGDRKILICKGAYSYLAVLSSGRGHAGLARRMRKGIEEVEATHREAIAHWNGSMEVLTGADEVLLHRLLSFDVRRSIKDVMWSVRKALMPARERRAPDLAADGGQLLSIVHMDPRDAASELLVRPQFQQLRPGYRKLMAEALGEIQRGRFTPTGYANVHMAVTVHRNGTQDMVGWWDLTLGTVREVLAQWPWDPTSQAWVPEESTAPEISGILDAHGPARLPAILKRVPLRRGPRRKPSPRASARRRPRPAEAASGHRGRGKPRN